MLALGMTAASSTDCSASVTAALADLDRHPGITWTSEGRDYAAASLENLCNTGALSAGADADKGTSGEEESTLFGLKVEKAPEDAAGRKRLKKTH